MIPLSLDEMTALVRNEMRHANAPFEVQPFEFNVPV